MPYKRPDPPKPDRMHPIQERFGTLGQITADKDPAWLTPHLAEVMDKGFAALKQFSTVVDDAKRMNLSDYKPEIAKARRSEAVAKARKDVLLSVRRAIEKASSNANAATAEILRPTEPIKPSDPVQAMMQELRFQEIRGLIRGLDQKLKVPFISGNLERIHAAMTSPDDLLPPATILQLRRDFVLSSDPSLADFEKDQRTIYEQIRKRAGQINSTAVRLLSLAEIDDPIDPADHYETFPPQGDYERYMAEKRILDHQKKLMKAEREKEITGINLGSDKRVKRIGGPIQH